MTGRLHLICLAVVLLSILASSVEATVIRSFSTRYENNVKGEIYLTGNVNLHAGSEVGGNNNNYNMQNVDVDADPTTFNSSRASYTLPPGAEVLWAGLYWGADTENSTATNPPDIAQRDRVLFSTGGGYQTIISQIPIDQNSGGYRYQAFSEVTNLVRLQAAGTTRTYTTANIQAVTGSGPSHYAGWALVIAIRDPAEVLRHLHVFDGFVQIDSSTPTDTTTVTGFRTPLAGAFNTQVGMVAYEGDLGTNGDYFEVNGSRLSNSLNSVDNFFNSSITRENLRVTSKNPDFVNQLGFDIDTVAVPYASGIIANGDTSANLTFGMTGDWYYPGVLTFAIDIFDPVLTGNITKSMVDLNGGALYGDDEIEFTIEVGNTGNDNAVDVVLSDPIPPNTTYVPGSLRVSSGANAGGKTDAGGDDQAEYDAGNDQVVFRLGTGADALAGGTLGIDQWTEVKFRVKVDNGVPPGTSIQNVATVDFIGEVSGLSFSATSNVIQAIAEEFVDLTVTKTSDSPDYFEGDTAVFTVTVNNAGPDTADNVAVTDLLPAGLLFQNAVPSQGTYTSSSGLWEVGSLAPGDSANLVITAVIDAGAASLTQPITNSAEAAADQIDTDPADNTANANITILTPSDLSTSTKLVADLNGGEVEAGDILRYTITLQESSGSAASAIRVTDDIPAGVTGFSVNSIPAGAVDNSTFGGTGANGTGYLDIADIAVPANGTAAIVFDVTVNGAIGTAIDNTADIANPAGIGASPGAPTLIITGPTSGMKPLYLYGPGTSPSMSRTPPIASAPHTNPITFPGGVSWSWPQSPVLQADVTLDPSVNPTIPVTFYRENFGRVDISVTLSCSGGGSVSSNTVSFNRSTPPVVTSFNLPLNAPLTCAAGERWIITINNDDSRDIVRIYPVDPASFNHSQVRLPSLDVINVDSVTFYDDSYANGGNLISSAAPGSTVFIRAQVSDPFGSFDINSANLTLSDPAGNNLLSGATMAEVYDSGAAIKIFERPYKILATGTTGNWTATIEAVEGTEGTVNDFASGSLTVAGQPSLMVVKSATHTVTGDPLVSARPGQVITYTVQVINTGSGPATTVTLDDEMSPYTAWSLDAFGAGQPYQLTQGSPASGLTLGTAEYSTDNGTSWTYTPVSEGGGAPVGYDDTVTNWRMEMNGSMAAGSSFTLRYQTMVR